MTRPGEFHPIRYDAQRASIPGELAVENGFGEQPLKFRMQVATALAPTGDPSNIVLIRAKSPVELQPPKSTDPMPGFQVQRVEFATVKQGEGGVFMVGPMVPPDRSEERRGG